MLDDCGIGSNIGRRATGVGLEKSTADCGDTSQAIGWGKKVKKKNRKKKRAVLVPEI